MGLRVFLSYRRDDSAFAASFVYEALQTRLGDDIVVFMDIDNIPPGRDFVDVIREAIESCDVVLVFVGPGWLTATDRDGRRRLDKESDFVRLEIELALRQKVLVIPVLVNGASMPHAEHLPASMAGFVRHNAFSIAVKHAHREVDELVSYIAGIPPGARLDRPEWVAPAADRLLEITPATDLVALRRAVRHAGSPWIGVKIAGIAGLPLEEVAYALLCIDNATFGRFADRLLERQPSSEAVGFSALAAALSGDLARAEDLVRTLPTDSPTAHMALALRACAEGDHEEAIVQAEPWARSVPQSLGGPTAAAAFALVADRRDDIDGAVRWARLLALMLPNGLGVLNLLGRCLEQAKDPAAALAASRRALSSWPTNPGYRQRFLALAEANAGSLGDEDGALVRYLAGDGPAPDDAWSSDGLTSCSCATRTYVDLTAADRVSEHFEVLLPHPVVAARCRYSGAAWVFVEMNAGAYRGVQLANVAYTEAPDPASDLVPTPFL